MGLYLLLEGVLGLTTSVLVFELADASSNTLHEGFVIARVFHQTHSTPNAGVSAIEFHHGIQVFESCFWMVLAPNGMKE